MSTIELRRITKRFGSFVAVRNVDLAVAAGEVLCLLGPSGCGKTTTLRVIAGLESATSGDVIIAGRRMNQLAPEKREQAAEGLQAAMRGEAAEHDSLLLDRLGNRIDVQLKLVPLHARDAIAGAYAIFKNVTAQKTAERTIALHSERVGRYAIRMAVGLLDNRFDAGAEVIAAQEIRKR